MIWENTAWDTPAAVSYECDFQPAIDLVREFFETHAIGFQGYPIENIDRPSPMDIYDVLCKHKGGGVVQDFRLMGLIPDEPPSSPEKDIEPDDTDYEDEASDEIALYESILSRMEPRK